jgi:hypothetical protein
MCMMMMMWIRSYKGHFADLTRTIYRMVICPQYCICRSRSKGIITFNYACFNKLKVLEETKKQQDRLKQLISGLGNGQKSSATKDKAQLPIPTPPRSLTNMFGRMMTSAESELIAAKEDAIVENAEIILYDMLTHLTERMNAANAIAILSMSLLA